MSKLFKITYESELYLIRCNGPEYLPQIHAIASDRFRLPSLQDLVFFYRDQSGDRVFVATEEDLALADETEDSPLKLKLVPRRRAAPAEPAEPAQTNVRHAATCDGCGVAIAGLRYKCGHCPDFDFCSKCHGTQPHPQDHVFLVCTRPIGRHVKPLLPNLQTPPRGCPILPRVGGLHTPLHDCPLTLTVPYNGHYICNSCGQPGRGPAHHCPEHKFDLHPRCARGVPLRTNTVVPPVPAPTSSAPAPVASVVPPAPATVFSRPLKLRFVNAAALPEDLAPVAPVSPVSPDLPAAVATSEPAPAAGRLLKLYPAVAPAAEVEVPRIATPEPAAHFPRIDVVVPVVRPAEPEPVAPIVPVPVPAPFAEPSAPAEPQPFEEELATLLAMGFDRPVAEVVLNLRNGDLALCIADLLGA